MPAFNYCIYTCINICIYAQKKNTQALNAHMNFWSPTGQCFEKAPVIFNEAAPPSLFSVSVNSTTIHREIQSPLSLMPTYNSSPSPVVSTVQVALESCVPSLAP